VHRRALRDFLGAMRATIQRTLSSIEIFYDLLRPTGAQQMHDPKIDHFGLFSGNAIGPAFSIFTQPGSMRRKQELEGIFKKRGRAKTHFVPFQD
jgi:hypothetical protein